jgi:hypothetical protein
MPDGCQVYRPAMLVNVISHITHFAAYVLENGNLTFICLRERMYENLQLTYIRTLMSLLWLPRCLFVLNACIFI